jgi:hypothetical protein
MVIFTKKRETNDPVIITCVGKDREQKIVEVAKELLGSRKKPVIIKNVGKDLEEGLLDLGCRHYRVDEWWDDSSKYDDQSFPQQVLNTAMLTNLEGSIFQSLREEYNHFHREYAIDIQRWKTCNLEEVEELLQKWIDNMHLRNDWNKEELRASHELFIKEREDFFHFGVYDKQNKKLIGFLVFSEISKKCLGFNVLVNDFTYKNLYRVLMLEAAKIALSLGYPYLNIQGSEDSNQYLSKRRLKAEFEIHKEHLIFDGQRCS